MLYRIISVLIALMFVLPAGSQSRSDSTSVLSQTPAATQAYSQLHQNSRRGIEFPKTRLGRVAVVSVPLITVGFVAKKSDGRFRDCGTIIFQTSRRVSMTICSLSALLSWS